MLTGGQMSKDHLEAAFEHLELFLEKKSKAARRKAKLRRAKKAEKSAVKDFRKDAQDGDFKQGREVGGVDGKGSDVDRRAKNARQDNDELYKTTKDGKKAKGVSGGPKLHMPKKDKEASAYGEKEGNPWHGKDGKFSKQSKVASGRGTFSLRGVKAVPKAAIKGHGGAARLGAAPAECGRDARGHAVGYKHGTLKAKYPDRVRKYRGDLRCWDKKLLSPDQDAAEKRGLKTTGKGMRKAQRDQKRTIAKLGQSAAAGRNINTKVTDRYENPNYDPDAPSSKNNRRYITRKDAKGKALKVDITHGIGVRGGTHSKRAELDDKTLGARITGKQNKRSKLKYSKDINIPGFDRLTDPEKQRATDRSKAAGVLKGRKTKMAKHLADPETFRAARVKGLGIKSPDLSPHEPAPPMSDSDRKKARVKNFKKKLQRLKARMGKASKKMDSKFGKKRK